MLGSTLVGPGTWGLLLVLVAMLLAALLVIGAVIEAAQHVIDRRRTAAKLRHPSNLRRSNSEARRHAGRRAA